MNTHKSRNKDNYIFNTSDSLYIDKPSLYKMAANTACALSGGDPARVIELFFKFTKIEAI